MSDPLYWVRKELTAARWAIDKMKRARSFVQFEAGWQDYLSRIERAWNKSAQAYTDSAFAPWRGAHEHARTSDDLLRYLKQARDAEEHTISETVASQPGAIGINPSSGTSLYIDEMTIDRGTIIRIKGARPGVRVTFIPGRAKLLPASSRGVTTPPPVQHLGRMLARSDPVSVAEAGLAYYEAMADGARAKFGRVRQ